MAEGHDHENIRVVEPHSKSISWKFEIKFCIVSGLQVWCTNIHDWAVNGMLQNFITILLILSILSMDSTQYVVLKQRL